MDVEEIKKGKTSKENRIVQLFNCAIVQLFNNLM
jgi:hypothetical protein